MAEPSAFERQLTLTPPRVLGRRLRPFTIGHAHLLETARSPFMGGGGRMDAGDLILAAWICSFPHYGKARRACLRALQNRVPWTVRRWGRRIGLDFSLSAEAETLARFIMASTRPPPSMRRADQKPVVTPAAITLAVLHRHYFGTSPAAVMDLPFLDALLDVIVWHHAQGKIELIDDRKAAFIEAVSKLPPPKRKPNAQKAKRK